MGINFYIKCDLFCISDDFKIQSNKTIGDSIIDSEKTFLRSIMGYKTSKKIREFFTGIEFDYSDIEIRSYYSRIFKRCVKKQKINHSSEPIQVSLYSEKFDDIDYKNINYRYVDHSDLLNYYYDVIDEFGTIENYENYLLSLKQDAYDILDDAIKDRDRSKRIKLTKVG